ncbi:polyadenylate-binding protein-interacting protein 2B-like [Macrobrachium nipponense]|uniref:polyadenylate-binding protein-interacting protein 2B-like n=1 Tax=Macrobrachium nipponense TaxID=159736 RepID=UPI0030C880FF
MRLPDNSPGRSQSNSDPGGENMNSNAEADFSEFMWMAEEDLEAFDHKVITEVAQVMMQQTTVTNNGCLREDEEEFLRRMLEEEEQRDTVYYSDYLAEKRRNNATAELESEMQKMGVSEDMAAKSTLNPYAAEFVPGQSTSGSSNPPDLIPKVNSEEESS